MSVIIYGRPRFFGLFGKEEDVVIPWDMVQTIGDDTILVRVLSRFQSRNRTIHSASFSIVRVGFSEKLEKLYKTHKKR